jgi:hypothetical protein
MDFEELLEYKSFIEANVGSVRPSLINVNVLAIGKLLSSELLVFIEFHSSLLFHVSLFSSLLLSNFLIIKDESLPDQFFSSVV